MRNLMAADQYHVEVRDCLKALSISGRKFAKMAGVAQPTVYLFLHGQRISVATRAKIEAAMARLKNG